MRGVDVSSCTARPAPWPNTLRRAYRWTTLHFERRCAYSPSIIVFIDPFCVVQIHAGPTASACPSFPLKGLFSTSEADKGLRSCPSVLCLLNRIVAEEDEHGSSHSQRYAYGKIIPRTWTKCRSPCVPPCLKEDNKHYEGDNGNVSRRQESFPCQSPLVVLSRYPRPHCTAYTNRMVS